MRCDKCPLWPSEGVCNIAYSELGIEHKDGMSGCTHSYSWCKKQADEWRKHFQYIGEKNLD